MKPYTLKLPAGAGSWFDFGAGADYVRVESSEVAVTFETESGGERVKLEQGEDARLSVFDGMRISHESATEQTVTIYIGRGTQKTSAKIAGNLVTESKERQAAMAAQAYMGSNYASWHSAAYGHLQMLNPAGSSTKKIVHAIDISPYAGEMNIALAPYDTPLPDMTARTYERITNMTLGGAITDVEIRRDLEAAPFTTENVYRARIGGSGAELTRIEFKNPIILNPGKGICLIAQEVAKDFAATFFWDEEPD